MFNRNEPDFSLYQLFVIIGEWILSVHLCWFLIGNPCELLNDITHKPYNPCGSGRCIVTSKNQGYSCNCSGGLTFVDGTCAGKPLGLIPMCHCCFCCEYPRWSFMSAQREDGASTAQTHSLKFLKTVSAHQWFLSLIALHKTYMWLICDCNEGV